jgi:hypothetical protein
MRSLFIVGLLLLGGCQPQLASTMPCMEDGDPMGDPTVTDSFRITLVSNPVVLVPGSQTAMLVRIDREPGFDLPVLVEVFGLPDGVWWQSREEREEDPDGIVIVYLNTSEDGAGDFTVPNFVVQGSDGTGLRQTDHGIYQVAP